MNTGLKYSAWASKPTQERTNIPVSDVFLCLKPPADGIKPREAVHYKQFRGYGTETMWSDPCTSDGKSKEMPRYLLTEFRPPKAALNLFHKISAYKKGTRLGVETEHCHSQPSRDNAMNAHTLAEIRLAAAHTRDLPGIPTAAAAPTNPYERRKAGLNALKIIYDSGQTYTARQIQEQMDQIMGWHLSENWIYTHRKPYLDTGSNAHSDVEALQLQIQFPQEHQARTIEKRIAALANLKALLKDPEYSRTHSNRAIAAELGMSHTWVNNHRKQYEHPEIIDEQNGIHPLVRQAAHQIKAGKIPASAVYLIKALDFSTFHAGQALRLAAEGVV